MPSFLNALAKPVLPKAANKKLIIFQLSGGNDGLNTFIPVRNDLYYKFRPSVAYKKTETLSFNG